MPEFGFYARRVLPRLLDAAMRNRALAEYRRDTVAVARGTVLEIGVGSGLNLPHYPPGSHVVGIDPAAALLRLAAARMAMAQVPVALVRASAECLPFPDAVFDSAVMTWTLCSIPQPLAALREVRRVLKRGGPLLFVEHGRSPEPSTASWQARLTPCWRRISGGCHLDRSIGELLTAAGFTVDQMRTGYLPGPRPWTYTYRGAARAADPP